MERVENPTLVKAESLFQDGDIEAAIAHLMAAVAEEPDELLIRVRLSDYLRRNGQINASVESYRACALEYADRGALPFAVALYKLIVPLLRFLNEPESTSRHLLHELVKRFQQSQERRGEGAVLRHEALESPPEIPLFADMSPDELKEVIHSLVPLRFKADEVLFKEGDEGASMFIVVKGYVRVSSIGRDGARIRLAKLGPGDFFGEWSLITGDYRRHAWVEPETDVELLELSEATLDAITDRHPRIKEVINAYYRRRKIDTLLAKVFPPLTPLERRRLAEKMKKEERYARGTIIYREGDTSEYMSIVQHGTVEVYTYNLDGVKIPLALLGPGQYFGEGGALSGKPRVASVRARTDVILHHVSREDLVTSLVDYPEVLNALQGVRVERIGATLQRLEGSEAIGEDEGAATAVDGIEEEAR